MLVALKINSITSRFKFRTLRQRIKLSLIRIFFLWAITSNVWTVLNYKIIISQRMFLSQVQPCQSLIRWSWPIRGPRHGIPAHSCPSRLWVVNQTLKRSLWRFRPPRQPKWGSQKISSLQLLFNKSQLMDNNKEFNLLKTISIKEPLLKRSIHIERNFKKLYSLNSSWSQSGGSLQPIWKLETWLWLKLSNAPTIIVLSITNISLSSSILSNLPNLITVLTRINEFDVANHRISILPREI